MVAKNERFGSRFTVLGIRCWDLKLMFFVKRYERALMYENEDLLYRLEA